MSSVKLLCGEVPVGRTASVEMNAKFSIFEVHQTRARPINQATVSHSINSSIIITCRYSIKWTILSFYCYLNCFSLARKFLLLMSRQPGLKFHDFRYRPLSSSPPSCYLLEQTHCHRHRYSSTVQCVINLDHIPRVRFYRGLY